MEIQLSDHFTYKKLIKFVLPSIVMMIFTSIYGVVDGLFVSNFAGKTAFAAINLIMPILMGLSALGFMIGTGGSAIVATTLGEGKKEKANAERMAKKAMDKLITRKEAASILGISVKTLDAARTDGLISYVQYVENGCVYFTEVGIQEYIAKCTHRAKPMERAATYRKPRSFRR